MEMWDRRFPGSVTTRKYNRYNDLTLMFMSREGIAVLSTITETVASHRLPPINVAAADREPLLIEYSHDAKISGPPEGDGGGKVEIGANIGDIHAS